MATRTLASLRSRCKQRSNMENSSFVSDTEWNDYINYSISELRDMIISKAGDDYFATSANFPLDNQNETYSLPTDFYKILWCELLGNDGYYYKMKRFEISEMNSNANAAFLAQLPEIRYRLREDKLWLNPLSALGGRTVRLWYVPLAPELSLDGDTLQGFNGWDEYIVLRAAIIALEKEESDTSALSMRLEQLRLRVEAMSGNRDQAQPMRIQDNERLGDWEWP